MRFTLPSFLLLLLATPAAAQTIFPEVEPNGGKTTATPIACMVAGDSIQGLTTGTSTVPTDASDATYDYFRVQTCALPPGVYRHRLVLSHPLAASLAGSIRGLQQLMGTIGTTEMALHAFTTIAGVRQVQWYGFGQSEELYVRIGGTTTTTGNYTLTLETVPVTPTPIAGSFLPGSITLDGNPAGPMQDSQVIVYDSTLHPIPGYTNDDIITFQTPFFLARPYAAGTYYAAVSVFGIFNDQPLPPDDHTWSETSPAMDFPGSVVRNLQTGAPALPQDISFQVTDGTTTTSVPLVHTELLDVFWFRFDVANATPATVFCLGDGSGTPCPCGNNSLPAEQAGCASSLGTGGRLVGAGVASVLADSFVLTGSQMPNSSALYFQGTTQLGGGLGFAFGDGLRCAGGAVLRLGTKINAAGTSAYPETGDVPISIRGAIPATGGTRTYQVWYRNAAAFCTTATFNLSNGIETTWIP